MRGGSVKSKAQRQLEGRIYGSKAWKDAVKAAIARAGGKCELRLPGCTLIATEGDHVRAPRAGGAWFDLGNIRAACRHCNASRGAAEAKGGGRYPGPSRDWFAGRDG
jgi:hypothetical protein